MKTLKVFLLLLAGGCLAPGGTTFRDDRISLDGIWKFRLARDNQLTTAGPVSFGPVAASSQAVLLEPWPSVTDAGRRRTAVPWPLSATVLEPAPLGVDRSQLWRPHPDQPGPVWWRADLGTVQQVAAVRLHWAKPGTLTVSAELSDDGQTWRPWARASSTVAEYETRISAAPARGRHVRLTFTPERFAGVRGIEVFFAGRDGSLAAWQPRLQRTWYEALRKFTPPDGFQVPGFRDTGWTDIRVPGYWEVQRFSPPTWWQPDETVGYYRRAFSVPERWNGRAVRLRFEGVNNGAQVWINGREIGYHESGFTPFEYDLTPYLQFGRENLIAVRVTKWTLTHEYDTDDVWFLGGIWRSAYLYSLPPRRIDDFTIRTEFDSDYRDAVLRARVTLTTGDPARPRACQVNGTLLDREGKEVPLDGFRAVTTLAGSQPLAVELASLVRAPRKWTAETPNLYTLLLRLKVDGQEVQQFRTTVGFRQVEVKGSSILLNGVPLTLRGVVTTRANPNDAGQDWTTIFTREIRILKESNINAIRSHTTPLEEEFLDLCDRHGIYVLPDVPYVWVNEYDFRYLTEGAVTRAREIYEAHKNRASVIIWHIGNENGVSSAYRGMGRAATWLHENDPSRPVTICSNLASPVEYSTTITDVHYGPMRQEPFLKPHPAPVLFGEFHALPEEIDRLKDLGFVETWGLSLKKEWAEFEKRPWVAGGLICCWDDGSVNGDLGPRQWGVVDSRRHAKPVQPHIRRVFAPLRLSTENGRAVSVTNRYNFTDLEGFRFRWELGGRGETLESGVESWRVPPGAAGTFPLAWKSASPESLRITVQDPEGFSVQDAVFRLVPRPVPVAGKGSLRAGWQPPGVLRVTEGGGRELLTVEGIVVQTAQDRRTNMPVGEVRFGAGTATRPFTIRGGKCDIDGSVRVESGADGVRVSYEWIAARDLTIRESGLRLKLAATFDGLAWERDSLWPQEGHESGPLHRLRETGSRRNVEWLQASGGGASLLLMPLSGAAHIRAGTSPQEIVWSDYLDSGDFLGKFDRETIEKHVKAGERQSGGVVIRIVAK